MTSLEVVGLARDTIIITLYLSGPLLLVGMVVGVIISIAMAVTQIQEMTLTFVPKILAVMVTLLFLSSWMISMITDFTRDLMIRLPDLIR